MIFRPKQPYKFDKKGMFSCSVACGLILALSYLEHGILGIPIGIGVSLFCVWIYVKVYNLVDRILP